MLLQVHTTLGALLIGLFISCCLFGIGTVQTYVYYTNFPKDRGYLKAMVMGIWLCELAHCICICHGFFYMAVNQYGNLEAGLLTLPKSIEGAISLSGVIGTVVQVFFVERVRIVSGRLFIPLLCWTMSLVRCALTFMLTGEAWKMHSVAEFVKDWKWLCSIVLGMGSVVDLFVAMSLSYYLNAQKASSFRSTSLMIDKITAWTIQTGVLTSLTGLMMLIFFLAMPDNYIWLGIFMFLARVFSNSLLASLNGRAVLRGKKELAGTQSVQVAKGAVNRLPVAIHISKTTEVRIDPTFEHGIF